MRWPWQRRDGLDELQSAVEAKYVGGPIVVPDHVEMGGLFTHDNGRTYELRRNGLGELRVADQGIEGQPRHYAIRQEQADAEAAGDWDRVEEIERAQEEAASREAEAEMQRWVAWGEPQTDGPEAER